MFPGVMLEDTFILGWSREDGRLVFWVEASLWPGHSEYEQPKPGEWTCYKPARLVFAGVEAVEGLPDPMHAPRSRDADGAEDFGTIHELVAEPGGYRLAGDFGLVRIKAKAVHLEVGRHK